MKRVMQFERTDRDIIDAFLTVLEEKPFEKITIQDIITKAMINRSTFYQHFADKYAILEKLQERYVNELTLIILDVRTQNNMGLSQIDGIMEHYFLKNRNVLKMLLAIRTEHVDISKELHGLFTSYVERNFKDATPLEARMMSSLFMEFFTYYLEHDELINNYSTSFFESTLQLTRYFFQLEGEKARVELLNLIGKYTTHSDLVSTD